MASLYSLDVLGGGVVYRGSRSVGSGPSPSAVIGIASS
jgi:hypothetical protein